VKNYVVGFAFRNNGKEIALIRKNRPEWQQGLLNGVGGKIEPMESCVRAVAREFAEEAGRVVSFEDWRLFARITDYEQTWAVYFFVTFCVDWTITRTDEEVVWVKVKDVIRGKIPTVPNLRWLVPLARDPQLGYTSSVEAPREVPLS
jgi:8-oxo-dGTP diphosphatase